MIRPLLLSSIGLLTGCASSVANWSDADLCGHKATMPSFNVYSGARDAEMAKRGTNCDTPEAKAEILSRKTGGWKVVHPEWMPEKGAEWARADCDAKAAQVSTGNWVNDVGLEVNAFKKCMIAYGFEAPR